MLPSAYGLGQYFQDPGHSFSPYGPPSRQITYMYDNLASVRIGNHLISSAIWNKQARGNFFKD